MDIETTLKLDDILKNLNTSIYVSPTAGALINESPIFMPLNNNDSLIGKYKNIDVFMSSKPISFIDMKIYDSDDQVLGDLSEILNDMGLNFDINDDELNFD